MITNDFVECLNRVGGRVKESAVFSFDFSGI